MIHSPGSDPIHDRTGIADPTIPLPHIGRDPSLDQVADFLQAYSAMEVNDLAAAIAARFPHLPFTNDSKHAIVAGWLRPQMAHAAFVLRQYVVDREMRALGQTA